MGGSVVGQRTSSNGQMVKNGQRSKGRRMFLLLLGQGGRGGVVKTQERSMQGGVGP